MNKNGTDADFGAPDLNIAGFQLWVHGREFPESEDAFDGNWLRVTAHCGASGASVWAQGALLMVTNLAVFGEECAAMHCGENKAAKLEPYEPAIKVLLKAVDSLGHIRATVEITADPLAQAHWFQFDIDQSYLPGIIQQCATLVQKFPVRGKQVDTNGA